MVVRIVGLQQEKEYLPMLWETFDLDKPEEMVFDFKYIVKRNGYGLRRPAVFTQGELRKLFKLYCQKAEAQNFP
jgi:hypothetical protein